MRHYWLRDAALCCVGSILALEYEAPSASFRRRAHRGIDRCFRALTTSPSTHVTSGAAEHVSLLKLSVSCAISSAPMLVLSVALPPTCAACFASMPCRCVSHLAADGHWYTYPEFVTWYGDRAENTWYDAGCQSGAAEHDGAKTPDALATMPTAACRQPHGKLPYATMPTIPEVDAAEHQHLVAANVCDRTIDVRRLRCFRAPLSCHQCRH